MSALDLAAVMCMKFEGFRARPYLCPANVPTIGFGATAYESGIKVTLADAPISKERATDLLMHTLSKTYLPGVLRYCPDVTGERLAALTDFAFNLGVGRLAGSTLRKRGNEQDWDGARTELMKWTRGGGRVLPGLVLRRQAEAALI